MCMYVYIYIYLYDGSIYLCMVSFSCRTDIITKYQNKLIQDVDLTIAIQFSSVQSLSRVRLFATP